MVASSVTCAVSWQAAGALVAGLRGGNHGGDGGIGRIDALHELYWGVDKIAGTRAKATTERTSNLDEEQGRERKGEVVEGKQGGEKSRKGWSWGRKSKNGRGQGAPLNEATSRSNATQFATLQMENPR